MVTARAARRPPPEISGAERPADHRRSAEPSDRPVTATLWPATAGTVSGPAGPSVLVWTASLRSGAMAAG